MARILLNSRASRITIVDNILLLPAEVKDDERLGHVISPSRTVISEKGKPSPFERIEQCPATQKLFEAKVLEWSNEKAEEPEPTPLVPGGRSPYPRVDQSGEIMQSSLGSGASPAGAANWPPQPPPSAGSEAARDEAARAERERALRAGTGERVKTDESVDALPVVSSPGVHGKPTDDAHKASTGHHTKAPGKGG